MAASSVEDNEWREGWPVVLSANLGLGSSLTLFAVSGGLFIAPMRTEFGWSVSATAFTPMVTLLSSLMMPLGGLAIDRFGSRRVAIFGICLFALAYVALATLPLTLPLLYSLVIALGMFGATGSAVPYVRGVATWFHRHSGSAFGAALAGNSVIGIAVIPVIAWVIEHLGWRAGYLAMTAFMLSVTLPLLLWLFRENPAANDARGSLPASGQSVREILADGRFWLLTAALGFAALPMGAFLTHLVPMLRNRAFPMSAAVAYSTLFALAIGIGRVCGGLLIDRFWAYGVAATGIGLAAIGCFAMTTLDSPDSTLAIGAAIFAVGLSYGAEVDFAAYFCLKLFGPVHLAKVFGIAALVLGGGMALGGMMASAFFDWTGSYTLLPPVAGSLFTLSAATILFMGFRHGAKKPVHVC